ncbi:SIR2 family NAD-dependent protein deacylase [Plebeiibacterium sediminum]|uniref:protein acetyllysine N-acetyltransferase n=1 Tax=Plebeiibacterium sediminum TaxID=2992112 RepID=A0AAE3M592_9BACT|nr:NAD-dependent deacylase [Plebeiobacterium sediminum]MCW3787077.1 NAD-dependent deacylase [Plebeiobacterium sediminum]
MIKKVAEVIKNSSYCIAFSGAGISVESGVPPFRGETGIWNRYNPQLLDLSYFYNQPGKSWEAIREIFYDFFSVAKPNGAHLALAKLEQDGILKAVVTQNIDNLHYDAGSKEVYEFHGNSQKLKCLDCNTYYDAKEVNLKVIPPKCDKCGGLLKPDFIFFGEGIPPEAYQKSFDAAQKADVVIVIGSTGEVMPACQVPVVAKQSGATIIEINPDDSNFTHQITDYHVKMKAAEAMEAIVKEIYN